MKEHPSNTNIQKEACRVLYNLACNGDNKEIISKDGGIHAIIQSMKQNFMSIDIQKEAFKALRNLCYHHEKNSLTIATTDTTKLIVDAMARHIANKEVQKEGCKLLYNLPCNNKNKLIISIRRSNLPG